MSDVVVVVIAFYEARTQFLLVCLGRFERGWLLAKNIICSIRNKSSSFGKVYSVKAIDVAKNITLLHS